MQYRKKPVIIDAWFMDRQSEKPDWLITAISSGTVQDNEPYGLYLKTPEGVMKAHYGRDYIIKGIHGELYPCKQDIFEETYEPTNAHISKKGLSNGCHAGTVSGTGAKPTTIWERSGW